MQKIVDAVEQELKEVRNQIHSLRRQESELLRVKKTLKLAPLYPLCQAVFWQQEDYASTQDARRECPVGERRDS